MFNKIASCLFVVVGCFFLQSTLLGADICLFRMTVDALSN